MKLEEALYIKSYHLAAVILPGLLAWLALISFTIRNTILAYTMIHSTKFLANKKKLEEVTHLAAAILPSLLAWLALIILQRISLYNLSQE